MLCRLNEKNMNIYVGNCRLNRGSTTEGHQLSFDKAVIYQEDTVFNPDWNFNCMIIIRANYKDRLSDAVFDSLFSDVSLQCSASFDGPAGPGPRRFVGRKCSSYQMNPADTEYGYYYDWSIKLRGTYLSIYANVRIFEKD